MCWLICCCCVTSSSGYRWWLRHVLSSCAVVRLHRVRSYLLARSAFVGDSRSAWSRVRAVESAFSCATWRCLLRSASLSRLRQAKTSQRTARFPRMVGSSLKMIRRLPRRLRAVTRAHPRMVRSSRKMRGPKLGSQLQGQFQSRLQSSRRASCTRPGPRPRLAAARLHSSSCRRVVSKWSSTKTVRLSGPSASARFMPSWRWRTASRWRRRISSAMIFSQWSSIWAAPWLKGITSAMRKSTVVGKLSMMRWSRISARPRRRRRRERTCCSTPGAGCEGAPFSR